MQDWNGNIMALSKALKAGKSYPETVLEFKLERNFINIGLVSILIRDPPQQNQSTILDDFSLTMCSTQMH